MSVSVYCVPYEQIIAMMLVDYQNLDEPPSDISKGSTPFTMSSVVATQIHGLRVYQDYITKQNPPGPETDTEFLNRHAGFYEITRTDDDTDETLLAKIQTRVRKPPAGGNANDFKNWALDQSRSFVTNSVAAPNTVTYFNAFAAPVDVVFGPGTVGVFTIPNDESIIFSPASPITGTNTAVTSFKLVDSGATFIITGVAIGFKVTNTDDNTTAIVTNVDSPTALTLDKDIFPSTPANYSIATLEDLLNQATFDYIESIRPLGMNATSVISSKPQPLNLILDIIAGPTYDDTTSVQLITEYRDSLGPGESFFSSQAECIAIDNGAQSARVTTPAAEETTIGNDFFHRGGSVITNVTI